MQSFILYVFLRKNVENQCFDTLPSRHVYRQTHFLTLFHANGDMRKEGLRRHDEATFKNLEKILIKKALECYALCIKIQCFWRHVILYAICRAKRVFSKTGDQWKQPMWRKPRKTRQKKFADLSTTCFRWRSKAPTGQREPWATALTGFVDPSSLNKNKIK